MEVGCHFQLSPYNLRIVVEIAMKPALKLSGSYWEPNYASEWSRSLFKLFMGHLVLAVLNRRRSVGDAGAAPQRQQHRHYIGCVYLSKYSWKNVKPLILIVLKS